VKKPNGGTPVYAPRADYFVDAHRVAMVAERANGVGTRADVGCA
jgi:hypothetical protein